MLKTRIIPTLLWKDVGLVKGVGFDSWRRVGTVLPSIKVYDTREVDELILVDITATKNHEEPDWDSLSDYADECFVPLTFGGGLSKIEHIRKALQAGADKVCINSAAYQDADLITKSANSFGSQCIVVSIDVRRSDVGDYRCFKFAGTETTNKNAVDWAKEVEDRGAGEILLTSIERDGTMKGYDLELLHIISSRVNIPVIASGGAGNYAHFVEAVKQGGASAVAAASIFHFTEQTPLEAKNYMRSHGIPVRRSICF